ncbi:alpha/beta hydrolase family protein [Pleomorphovibrio marinus]|uniref:alpha/beta hydrolase family protein n=1 Tax=Pleomorphovibrio marinus TaxID=2164132 RepID=UPI000E0C06DE|nr:acetylxylan esterase [Pleomorphovibrio marinus]
MIFKTVYHNFSLILLGLLIICIPEQVLGQKSVDPDSEMLCVGAHWTEEEGAEFLKNRKAEYQTEEEWKKRATKIRNQILRGSELMDFPSRYHLEPIQGRTRRYEGYSVTNYAIQTLPGVYVTGSLYKPHGRILNLPGVLSPHGHFDEPGNTGRYREDAQMRFASLAKMGAVVWAYDAVGYGEMADIGWEHKHPKALKQQLWNSLRGVDFLISQGVDPEKIAITGASGGGTQSFLLAAIDERISVSVPVVMVSAHFFGGCVCESGMQIHKSHDFQTNNVEIAALAAPRPMLLVSTGNDWTKNTPEVEYPHIRHIYGLMGAEENVEYVHLPDDQHDYDENKRKAVYPFLAKHLGLDLSKAMSENGDLLEDDIVIERQETLYIFDIINRYPEDGVTHNDQVKWE